MFKKTVLVFLLIAFGGLFCSAETLNGGASFEYNKAANSKLENIKNSLPSLDKNFVEVYYSLDKNSLDLLNESEFKTKKHSGSPVFYTANTTLVPESYDISFSTGRKKTNVQNGETIKLLLKKYPNNKDVLLAYAIQLKNENSLDGALNITNKILNEEPDFALAHFLKGDILRSSEQFQEAVNEYLYTTQLNPYCADAYYNIAKILELLETPDLALDYYKMAYQINPNDTEIRDIIMEYYIDL